MKTKECIIEMPSALDSNVNDILTLVNMFKKIENSDFNDIILDFKNTRFFASELYMLYHHFVDYLKTKKITIKGINVKENVDYVMRLSDFSSESVNPKYSSLIQHKDFTLELDNNNLDCFDEYLKKEFLPKFVKNENISSIISSYLSELFVNARTHGNTHKIKCSGQKYQQGKLLKFLIVDFGVTIPFNVSNHIIKNKKNYYENNDAEAIRWASQEGNTTKEKLGGLGLNDISEFIKKFDGKIKIISRNGYYELNKMKDRINNYKVQFDGTLIIVELNLEKIEKMIIPQKKNEIFEI